MSTLDISCLTPEELQQLEVPQDLSPRLITQYAKQLHAVGLTKKALRYDQCLNLRVKRCETCHLLKQIFKCGLKMCSDCAHLNSRDTLERWAISSKEMIRDAAPDDQLVYVDVLLPPYERTREAVEHAFELIENHFYANQPGPTWMNVPAFEGRSVRIRALMITKSTRTAAEWRSLLPGTVEAYVTTMDRLLSLQAMLLAPDLPKSTEDRAEQERIFNRMHNVRKSRMRTSSLVTRPAPTADLSVTEQTLTDMSLAELENLPEEAMDEHHLDHDHCSICGARYTHASDWFRPGEKMPKLAEIKWHPI